jgi:GxxExxY protein
MHANEITERAFLPGTAAASAVQGLKLDRGYGVAMLVADTVVVEVKAVQRLAPVHEAQLLTYTSLCRATALYAACSLVE